MRSSRVLVLGLGNILMQDEGLGVHALRRLVDSHIFPQDVQLLDGGTMGLALLPHVAAATDLLILDCVDKDEPAGTLLRLEGPDIRAALSLKMSIHQVGLQDLLAASSFQGTLPARVVVWGMQPEVVDWGVGLTPRLEGALEHLVEAAVGELESWGVEVRPVAVRLGLPTGALMPAARPGLPQ
jgi:hydrogenase maturation protease